MSVCACVHCACVRVYMCVCADGVYVYLLMGALCVHTNMGMLCNCLKSYRRSLASTFWWKCCRCVVLLLCRLVCVGVGVGVGGWVGGWVCVCACVCVRACACVCVCAGLARAVHVHRI